MRPPQLGDFIVKLILLNEFAKSLQSQTANSQILAQVGLCASAGGEKSLMSFWNLIGNSFK
jgi:hypothetical protein